MERCVYQPRDARGLLPAAPEAEEARSIPHSFFDSAFWPADRKVLSYWDPPWDSKASHREEIGVRVRCGSGSLRHKDISREGNCHVTQTPPTLGKKKAGLETSSSWPHLKITGDFQKHSFSSWARKESVLIGQGVE